MSALAWTAAILACGLGAVTRYLIARLDPEASFPWPTAAANALGCLVIGAAAAAVAGGAGPSVMLIAGSGFAGGLTTFSTLALDAVALLERRRAGAAGAYLLVTLGSGVACVALGYGAWTALA